jgi:hypothetical protein
MKTKRLIFLTLVMVLLLGTIATEASSISSTAASQPWFARVIDPDEQGVQNLSTAFVGARETPMLSYNLEGSHRIYQVHAATAAVAGNCGPGNAWYCNYWDDSDLVPGTVSNIATQQILDSHLIKWAYSTGSTIRGATVELLNDMSFQDDSWEDLIQINKFGSMIIGTPSIQISGGHFEMAVTIADSSDLFGHQLVYLHYTGNELKTSCMDSGSVYDCEVIETSFGFASMGAPSLQIDEEDHVGIAYYHSGGVKYAYPWGGLIFLRPANCGPLDGGGEPTWRCIFIDDPETGSIGPVVKLAFGSSADVKGIVYDQKPTDTDFVMRATYVGSGGNCGVDGLNPDTFDPVYRWNCSDVDAFIDDIDLTTYSITFDPQDYPVIAWNNQRLDEAQRLYITYPTARLDGSSAGWTREIIDGNDWSFTGIQNSISINSAGLGLIGYVQPSYSACDICLIDIAPNLKIALQSFASYLPTVRR